MSTRIDKDDVTIPGTASIDTLKITGGTPADGNLLISDSDGVFTSQAPTVLVPSGSKALSNGVDAGNVTGLALGYTPSRVIVSVSRPIGEDIMFACVDSDSLTPDGFSFALSGQTTSANFVLNYIILK